MLLLAVAPRTANGDNTDMAKKKKEIRINIRVPETEKEALKDAAEKSGLTETLVVRSAIKKAVADIHKQIDSGKGVAIVI